MSMSVDVAVALDQDAPALLKVLAEPLRWRILQLLVAEDLCVCHLTEELDAPQPLVSHHLRVLRDAGLVSSERWRYWTYYRLEPARLAELRQALAGFRPTRRRAGDRRRPCC
jgi:ArsR family transcriptional regulator